MRPLLWSAVLALCSLSAWAIDPAPPLADPVAQQRYIDLIHELRCLKCQGETVADTQALFAVDIRRQVREMVQSGKSDYEVRQSTWASYARALLGSNEFLFVD